MNDILQATEAGDIRFMMTSATQSNSGALFYFGALNAFAGNPTVVTSDDLNNPDVQEKIKRILARLTVPAAAAAGSKTCSCSNTTDLTRW
ncbi:MAG: hypothetical protein U0703_11765 [Anaerolineae bacterium]